MCKYFSIPNQIEREGITDMELSANKEIEHYTLENLSTPVGTYSHGVIAQGFLFTCGVGPADPVTGEFIGEDIISQTRQVFRNLELILAAKNLDFSKVVKLTGYLQNITEDFKAYDAVCREFLSAPYPARTTVGASLPNILVEIDCIVAL
jgi:2-iminobutanoate/2-iminopropanoate deaminase